MRPDGVGRRIEAVLEDTGASSGTTGVTVSGVAEGPFSGVRVGRTPIAACACCRGVSVGAVTG